MPNPTGIYDPLTARGPGRGEAHVKSYWADTIETPPPDDGPLRDAVDTDVAIIGAGFTGLSCAAHLSRRYGAKAIVLEANRPLWGCSGRNGSFARPVLGRVAFGDWISRWGEERARALFAESMEALNTVRALIRDGDIDCDVQPEGALRIAHCKSQVWSLEHDRALLQRVFNHKSEVLSPDDLAKHHFKGEEAFAALRFYDGFGLHPIKFGHGIVRMARNAGAVVHSSTPVTAWRKDGNVHVLSTPGGEVRAPTIVFATNGYTPEHLHRVLRGGLLPVLSNIIVTRPMTDDEQAACNLVTTDVMYDTRKFLNYFRLLPDRRILLGNRGPIRATEHANRKHREWLLNSLRRKFPPLHSITSDYFWGGWVALSYDAMPHITCAEDDPTVHLAVGYCGSGVVAAPHAGRRLAERLGGDDQILPQLGAPLPRIPLAAFRRITQRIAFLWYRFCDQLG